MRLQNLTLYLRTVLILIVRQLQLCVWSHWSHPCLGPANYGRVAIVSTDTRSTLLSSLQPDRDWLLTTQNMRQIRCHPPLHHSAPRTNIILVLIRGTNREGLCSATDPVSSDFRISKQESHFDSNNPFSAEHRVAPLHVMVWYKVILLSDECSEVQSDLGWIIFCFLCLLVPWLVLIFVQL